MKSWITEQTAEKFKIRDRCLQIARQSGTQADWDNYRYLRNDCTTSMRADKKAHFAKIYSDLNINSDIGGLYRVTKEQLGQQSGGPPKSLIVEGRRINSPREMAIEIQKACSNKIKDLIQKLPPGGDNPLKLLDKAMNRWRKPGQVECEIKEISVADTLSLINELGKSTAFGGDYIDAQSIKLAANTLANPISHLVNLSLRNGNFPNRWKLTRVVPLHKGKGADKTYPRSYRTISLVATISKVTEKADQRQVLGHMDKFNMINHNHHAYRPGHSTTTTLLQLSDAIMTATDKSLMTTLVTVDESAAFDCVSHPILVRKLRRYGFGPKTIKWFENYLCGRRQYISIGDKSSPAVNVGRGVPQGSVLGPLLYTLYVNELPEAANRDDCNEETHKDNTTLFPANCTECGQIPCYADDATLAIPSKDRQEAQTRMMETMDRVKRFLNSNELTVNKAKTNIVQCMISQKRAMIGGDQPQMETVDSEGKDIIIKAQEHIRLLGINYSQNLTWDNHLETGGEGIVTRDKKDSWRTEICI